VATVPPEDNGNVPVLRRLEFVGAEVLVLLTVGHDDAELVRVGIDGLPSPVQGPPSKTASSCGSLRELDDTRELDTFALESPRALRSPVPAPADALECPQELRSPAPADGRLGARLGSTSRAPGSAPVGERAPIDRYDSNAKAQRNEKADANDRMLPTDATEAIEPPTRSRRSSPHSRWTGSSRSN